MGEMTKSRVKNMPADDWRTKNDEYKEPHLSRNLALAYLLTDIDQQHGARTAGEVAIPWTLLNPVVTAAIVGMRRPDQVDGVIHAASIELTAENQQAIFSTVTPSNLTKGKKEEKIASFVRYFQAHGAHRPL